jgi:hypothetical protein
MSIVWRKTLCIGDKNDLDTLDKLEKETQVEVFLTQEACPDFLVDNTTGKITPNVKSICINGTQWNLVPGKNRVPASVYELLVASEASLQKAKQHQRPQCIGRF